MAGDEEERGEAAQELASETPPQPPSRSPTARLSSSSERKISREGSGEPSAHRPPEGRSIASRGIPSEESMYLPPHDSPVIRSFQDAGENPTRNMWDLEEVVTFVFPRKYQAIYHSIAVKFLRLLVAKTRLEGSELAEFISKNGVSKATFYNRVLPRLRRVGMIKIERHTIVAKESLRKYRPMTIHLGKTFGNYLMKIGDSWLAIVDEARSKFDQQKRLGHFEEK